MFKPRAARPRPQARAACPLVERLESRRLLSAEPGWAAEVNGFTFSYGYLDEGHYSYTLTVTGTTGNDAVTVSADADHPGQVVFGLNGTRYALDRADFDPRTYLFIHGGGGNDRLESGLSAGPSPDAFAGVALCGDAGNDTLIGGDGNDDLRGGDGNDLLLGRGGDDYLDGEAGNDWLFGGAGDDTLHGGVTNPGDPAATPEGDDLLVGGDGSNRLFVEDGRDRFYNATRLYDLRQLGINLTFDADTDANIPPEPDAATADASIIPVAPADVDPASPAGPTPPAPNSPTDQDGQPGPAARLSRAELRQARRAARQAAREARRQERAARLQANGEGSDARRDHGHPIHRPLRGYPTLRVP